MPRNLPPLLNEESAAAEQSRVFHLITVELAFVHTTCSGLSGSSVLTVADASRISIGQQVTVYAAGPAGANLTSTVTDIVGSVVTIADALSANVTDEYLTYTLIFQMVDSNYDILFNGVTYNRFPVRFDGIGISTDGTIEKAKLSIANVSREIMYYVESYDGLRNRPVTVRTVFERFLDLRYTVSPDGTVTTEANPEADSTAYILDSFIVDSYSATEQVVEFTLDPAIDLEVKMPRRAYTESCYWKYRDPDTCRYTGEEIAGQPGCPKTLSACQTRNNQANFGGFVGLVGNRRVYL